MGTRAEEARTRQDKSEAAILDMPRLMEMLAGKQQPAACPTGSTLLGTNGSVLSAAAMVDNTQPGLSTTVTGNDRILQDDSPDQEKNCPKRKGKTKDKDERFTPK